MDKLSTPSSTAVSEGADVTDFEDKFESVARLGNYVQKLRRSYRVSDLQQAVSSVGPQDIARAEMKAVKELKRDVEKTILGTQDRAAENGGGTAYTSKGNLPNLRDKFAYACWGSEKGSNKPATSLLPKALKSKGATVVGSEMAGVGHSFAESEHPKVAEWLAKVALAAPTKK